jgi:MFS transporter, DHA1 family, tetracycline resistance protein
VKGFTGNTRVVAVTEPFFSVPYNLFSTYASVYMMALGCTATQVGIVSSVGLVASMVLSLAGGTITDRMGRRRATFVFDLVSWSGATLLWAFAGGIVWFLAAAVVNSFVRIVQTSWSCLMTEDATPGQRVHVYAWIYIIGIIAGLLAPAAGLLVEGFGLVPAMRGMYLCSFAIFTFMFIWRNTMLRESAIGLAKQRESRNATPRATLADYRRVAGLLARDRLAIAAFLISTLVSIQAVLKGTFQAILLTRGLGFSDASIAVFPAAGAFTTLLIYVLALPSLSRRKGILPLAGGIGLSMAGVLALAASPAGSWAVVTASTLLTAAGSAVMVPYSDTLVANAVPEADRSKALSLFYVFYFTLSAPWGYLGGLLFAAYDRLPFLAAAAILGACLALALAIPGIERRRAAQGNRP